MAATVKIGPFEATCTHYHWSSGNAKLAEALNTLLSEDGPSGADPNPDLTAAEDAVQRLGGSVIKSDKAHREPGRIY